MNSTQIPSSASLFSIFSNVTRALAPSINKEIYKNAIQEEVSGDQLLIEYCSNHLLSEYCSDFNCPQTILEKMKKERDLFIATTKLTN